jgi:hypothetical protein
MHFSILSWNSIAAPFAQCITPNAATRARARDRVTLAPSYFALLPWVRPLPARGSVVREYFLRKIHWTMKMKNEISAAFMQYFRATTAAVALNF